MKEKLIKKLNFLLKETKVLSFDLEKKQLEKMIDFVLLFKKWNNVYNLSAIKDDDSILKNHILDSLSCSLALKDNQTVIDVGTGAGFPSTPLAIAFPKIKFYQIEKVAKKVNFLNQVKLELKIDNIKPKNIKIEDFKSDEKNLLMSRAFTNVDNFLKLTKNLGNDFLLMQSKKFSSDSLELTPEFKICKIYNLSCLRDLIGIRYLVKISKRES